MLLKFEIYKCKFKAENTLYLKITKIQVTSQTLPQLLNFHNQILTHKS